MSFLRALCRALALYTRLDVYPAKRLGLQENGESPLLLLWGMIPAGVLIGGVWVAAYYLMRLLQIAPVIFSILCAVCPHWMSGYMHLLGFMEISGNRMRQKNRGSNSAAFGAISLCLLLLVQTAGAYSFIIWEENGWLLFFIPIFSREMALVTLFLLPALASAPTARTETPHHIRRVVSIFVFLFFTGLLCAGLTGGRGVLMVVGMMLAYLFSILILKKGVEMTGDSASYALTLSETAALIVLAVFHFTAYLS